MTITKTISVYAYDNGEEDMLHNGVDKMRIIQTNSFENISESRIRVQFLDAEERVIQEADFFDDELKQLFK